MPKRTTMKMSKSAKRWLKRAAAFIVTLGTVAGAITAIKALLPEPDPPDPRDSAELSVRVISQVRLSDYARRLNSAQPQGFRRAQPTDASTGDPTVEPTENTTEVTTGIPPTTPTTTGPSSSRPVGAHPRVDSARIDDTTGRVLDELPYCKRHRDKCVVKRESIRESMRSVAAAGAKDANGNDVEPEVAAQRVLEILKDARKTAEQEPIGAIVTVDAVLVGLRDRPVLLTWAMWHAAGGGRLHADWFNEHLAYQLRATTDHDSATVHLWVPLPAAPGPFLVDVEATVDGVGLDSDRSVEFE